MILQNNPHTKSVLIIGAGVGGLFLGAMLAKEGLRVTVVEKNTTIGGGLQTFVRFGECFDTGMHIIGGMQEGGSVRRICQWLGIADKVKLRSVDADCADLLYFAEDGRRYNIPSGREAFVERLANYFPEEHEGLQRYVDALYRLSEEADLFYLRPSTSFLPAHSAEFVESATALIAHYVTNQRLRSVLAYMNPLYGGREDETPAYVHALISVLYINGVSRFVGGSSHFANLLAEVIKAAGGEVLTDCAATRISVTDRCVDYVETQDGRRFTADYYVSSIHPCSLLKLLPEEAFPRAYRTRLDDIPNSYSAFSVYVKLRPEAFPYINHSEFYMTRYDDIWHFGRTDRPWPLGFLMMTPPDDEHGTYARKVLITAPMSFDRVRQWENTTVGQRGDDYKAWKQHCLDLLLNQVEEIHPHFREAIDKVNTASPLTIRDYYNVKEGAMCGYSKDCHNMVMTQLPVVTKVKNLLLTGQNINLHGFCGVPLTAINTAEAILGQNYIINRINEATR